MAGYTTYYGICEHEIDHHYEPGCNFQPEKARIRRGAWLKHSSYLNVIADPTDITLWQAAMNAGELILLPELKGSMDGGTPKMEPGFGDQKETYAGSDFKASISDRVYKENWPHYRSLVGQTDWHFVYLTETYIHITDVPVTVSPKNPISDSVEDSVLWVSDISWFQFFTPAPHVAPVGFMSLKAIVIACPVVTADATTNFITLTWAPIPGNTDGYDVKAYTTPGGSVAYSGTTAPDVTTYRIGETDPNTTYYYVVSQINGGVPVGNCGLSSITTDPEISRAIAWFTNFVTLLTKPIGTVLTVIANEPGPTFRTLAVYPTVAGDDDQVTLAGHLVTAIGANSSTTGYPVILATDTIANDSFKVTARFGMGPSMNGQNLEIDFTGGSVSTPFSGGA